MSKYDELVKFRNKLTNDTDCVIFEEDCQLLDNVLDDLEQKDKRIAELEIELESKKSALRFAKASYDLLADENARLNKLLKEKGIE